MDGMDGNEGEQIPAVIDTPHLLASLAGGRSRKLTFQHRKFGNK